MTATPQGRRPTGTDFSALRLAASMRELSPDYLANVPGRCGGSRRAFAESEHAEHRHDKADDQHGGGQRRQVLVKAAIDVEQ
jgi:hypothetical protein